jgi:cytochrome c5
MSFFAKAGGAALPLLFGFAAVLPGHAVAQLTQRQMDLVTNNCLQCHSRPGIGVPLVGDPASWNGRASEKMMTNVVLGLRGMPPLGYCSACSEEDLRAMTKWMSSMAKGAQ